MNWEQLLSTKRLGQEDYIKDHDRTEFQRDYDRLIFSSPFRRLQNKTQVFPLPGSVFVHNRLTHSLEVSCVGRSLGNYVVKEINAQKGRKLPFLFQELGAIVAAGCLAHDMGNPPFGHSGEAAICSFFKDGNGAKYKDKFSPQQWNDFLNYEGNANALRLLCHQFEGRRKGGFALTYSTLASIIKYPYQSGANPKKGKFGFFQAEKDLFLQIVKELGIKQKTELEYCRHPLVYLVEAADDICYQIMDIEDAFKLRILTEDKCTEMLLSYLQDDPKRLQSILNTASKVNDVNERIVYFRSCAIGKLVEECGKAFVSNEQDILNGTFDSYLIKSIGSTAWNAYSNNTKNSVNLIYKSNQVVEIEMAGHRILSTLLDIFTEAVFEPQKKYSQLLIQRIPSQYNTSSLDDYDRILSVLDYISGMTDVYALDLYRKITGINVPQL